MTLLEKHQALLEDLLEEYDQTQDGSLWKYRLERKIEDMKEAIKNLEGKS